MAGRPKTARELSEGEIYLLRIVGASGSVAMNLQQILQYVGPTRPDLTREEVRGILSHLVVRGYLDAEADGYVINPHGRGATA
jgi:hypothetical protein